jgi:general secretion pathway protein D
VIKKLIIVFSIIGLMSCASNRVDLPKEIDGNNYLEGLESNKYSGAVFNVNEQDEADAKKEKHEFYPGSGEFINMDAAKYKEKVITAKGDITFNFEGDPLPMVVNLILGQILKENYVIAPGVSGSVTFATVKPINKDQVMPILEMLLSWNNASIIFIEDRYHVMAKSDAIKGNLIPSYGEIEQRKGYTVMVVPLDYIAPSEMEKILAPYAKEGAVVKADNARNLLFLSGTKRELSMYMDTIKIFDVDWLEGMSTGIFTLERVEAGTIVGELEALFGEGADNPLAGMFRFMPIERLNAIMVITPQKKYLHKAKEWILRLDRADAEASSNLYVYNVKNIKATDLAGYLNDVFGGSGGSSSSSKASSSGNVAPGLNGKEIGSNTNNSKEITKTRNSSGGNKDGINFTAIEENNQILISANAQDYESIMSAISRLDIEPLQVFIEAKIIEVTLSDNFQFGVDWLFGSAASSSSSNTNIKGLGGIRETESSSLGRNGLSYVLTGIDVNATITSLQKNGVATVLSTPSMLVLNNKQASINVGQQIPIPTNSYSNTNTGVTGGVFRTVSYKQTGTDLQITPRINPGGLVYIELSQEVSVPGTPNAETNDVPIDNRTLSTEIAVQSGETVVMGGLIKHVDRRATAGVPVLKKIPLLGKLFQNETKDIERTELLVLITPTVVENPEQAKQLTKEYANQFKGLKPLNVKETQE